MKEIMRNMLLLFITMQSLCLLASPIDSLIAKQVAQTFLRQKSPAVSGVNMLLQMARPMELRQTMPLSSAQATPAFYIFNRGTVDGFVIIAADDRIAPVLGYAERGSFDPDNMPPNVQAWFEGYQEEIRYAIAHNIAATDEIAAQWSALQYEFSDIPLSAVVVAPLLTTKWNQTAPYRNLCPMDGGSRSYTGCVATAMAQIMKFYNHPTSRTVTIPAYTTTTRSIAVPAITGTTTYDWTNMLDTYSGTTSSAQQTAVATLMYHCGASVEMDYSANSSGASSVDAAAAFPTYFKYDASIRLKRRDYCSASDWHAILRTELDAGRPVFYAGNDGVSGHAFVCDGYSSDNYFHFNWGWGGSYDADFLTSALNPGTGGTGAGSGVYNYGQQIIYNIKPNAGGTTAGLYELGIYDTFSSTSPVSVNYGQQFDVDFNFINISNNAFPIGQIGVALVNNTGTIVNVLQTETLNVSLSPNYYYAAAWSFSCSVPSSVPLGSYILRAVANTNPADGAGWRLVAAQNNGLGAINITVGAITPPTVTTGSATNIQATSATVSKTVIAGSETITAQGFRYKKQSESTWQTSTTGLLTGLSPSTIYQYYAYATTASGTTNGITDTFTTLAATALCAAADRCNYTLIARDSEGDGWDNNGYLSFKQNGVEVATATVLAANGTNSVTFQIPLCPNLPTTIEYFNGAYFQEVSFELKNPFGIQIFAVAQGALGNSSAMTLTNPLYSFTTNCSNYALQLHSAISIPDTVQYGIPYTISTTVKNSGTATFSGSLYIAVFYPDDGQWWIHGSSAQVVTISAGGTQNYTYQFGGTDYEQGTHKIRMAYKQTGSSDYSAIDGGIYSYYAEFTVVIVPPTVVTLAATNIQATSATLNKTVTAGSEIIIAQGFKYKKQSESTWQTSTTGLLTGLSPSTIYQYYAYATTASGTTDGATNTFTTLATTVLCAAADRCNYTLIARDSRGDGWDNNGYLSFKQNGVEVATATVLAANGTNSVTFQIPLCPNLPTTIEYIVSTPINAYFQEVSFELKNPFGIQIFAVAQGALGNSSAMTLTNPLYSFTTNCSNYALQLHSAISIPNTVQYGIPYTISTTVKNSGTATFSGSLYVAVYDQGANTWWIHDSSAQVVTISAGGTQNYSYQFGGTEYPLGNHEISMAYKQTSSSDYYGIDGGIYDYYAEFTVVIVPPTVVTLAATNVQSASATLNKTVTAGSETIIAQGFRYKKQSESTWQTSTTGLLTGLSPSTIYQYYAYATTASGTTNGATNAFTTTALCAAADRCNYTLIARDSQGDGWDNNGYLSFKQNGVEVATATVLAANGTNSVTFQIPLCPNLPTTIGYINGAYFQEVSFELKNPLGIQIFAVAQGALGNSSAMTLTNPLYSFTTNCSNVVPPTVTTGSATNIHATSATVSKTVIAGTETIISEAFKYKKQSESSWQISTTGALTGLSPTTIYQYYAYATTATTITDGEIKTFTTSTLSNDANLATLTVDQGVLTPTFVATTTNYAVVVGNSVTNITISATAAHANASLTGVGNKSLNAGENLFAIMVTAEDGTTQKVYTVLVTKGVSIAENEPNQIRIYPNPAEDELYIETADGQMDRIEICDMLGKSILAFPKPIFRSIDISALSSGIYVVKIEINNQIYVRKFIKK